MKTNKKLLAVLSVPAIASLLAVAVTTPVKAADRDFTDTSVSPAVTYSYDDYTSSDEKFDSLVNAVYAHPSNFLYEMGGKHYQYSAFVDTYTAAKKTGVTAAQAYKTALANTPVVTLVSVTSVDAVNAVAVDNGTTADKLGLPTTVGVTLSDGTKDAANVTWDTTKFDGTKAGDQTITGTLSTPTGKSWTLTDAQKTVSVKVTVKAPVSALSSVSVVNATTVQVVLNDKPTADLTNADASKFAVTVNGNAVAAPTAVTKVASDLTGKTYKLTIATLDGQQGDLAINGVKAAPATGMVYGFDYQAPTLQSVTAKGTKTVILQFNEKLSSAAGNIVPSNFGVKSVVGGGSIAVNTAILDATGTKVTLTLNSALTVADYVVTLGNTSSPVVNVTDVAGNGIYNGTQIAFRPTAAQLQDTSAPSLVSAIYDKVSGKLTIAMDKNITAVDTTKLSINGVALTASDVASITTNTAVITLSDATKTALNALSGSLTLTSAANAYGDATASTTGESLAVSLQQPAVIKTVAYDQQTSRLTVKFDQAVTLKNSNVLTVTDNAGSTATITKAMAINADGTTNDGTVASDTWTFDCTTVSTTIEHSTTANLKAYIAAGAVTNGASVDNVVGQDTYANGVSATYTAITAKPVLASAVYNNNTGKLVLTFNQSVKVSDVDATKIKLWQANGTALAGFASLSGLTPAESGLSTTLTYAINPTNDSALALAFNNSDTVKVTLDAGTVDNKAALYTDATTYTTGGVGVGYQDFKAPTVASAAGVGNQNLVSVTFSKPVDAATAQNVNNYVIKDTTGKQLTVTKAVTQPVAADGTETVYLTTDTQVAGTPYTITVSNVKDTVGNIISATNTATFTGSSTADVSALAVTGVTPAAPKNSKNDTLNVTFNAPVDSASATNVANYVVLQADADTTTGWNNATQVSLSDATVSLTSANSVTIKLGAANLQNSKYYKVVASNVLTSTGKALGTTNTATAQLTNADTLSAPTMTATQTATGAIKLVFDQELDATAATTTTNYAATSNGTGVTVTKATYSFDSTTGKATVVLDLASAPSTPVGVTLTSNIKNLAGVSVTGAGSPITVTTLTDNVAPSINTVAANIAPSAADDNIVITFNDSDVLAAAAGNTANYVIKDAAGNVIPSTDYDVTFNDNAGANGVDTVTIAFDKAADSGNAYNLKADGTYTITISGILDNSGNAMTSVTKTATLSNPNKNGDTITAGVSGTASLTGGTNNVYAITGSSTDTIGNVTLTASHVDIKKTSTSDFALRVYDASGNQVALSDTSISSVKTLLFGQLSGGTSKQLSGNISMNFGQLTTAMNNVAGTTVGSVQVDLYDLAGNKTTVTLNITQPTA